MENQKTTTNSIPILTFNYATKATNYLHFKKALGDYCIEHFKEIRSSILTGNLEAAPQAPADPGNIPNNMQLHIWKTEYDRAIIRIAKREEELRELFELIRRHLSNESRYEIEHHPDYHGALTNLNGFTLFTIITRTHSGTGTNEPEIVKKIRLENELINCCQGQRTIEDYFSIFKDCADRYQGAGFPAIDLFRILNNIFS